MYDVHYLLTKKKLHGWLHRLTSAFRQLGEEKFFLSEFKKMCRFCEIDA